MSKLFLWELDRDDPLRIRRGVARMMGVAWNLLVLQTVLKVDWDAMYAGVSIVATVRYLYYDYDTGGC